MISGIDDVKLEMRGEVHEHLYFSCLVVRWALLLIIYNW